MVPTRHARSRQKALPSKTTDRPRKHPLLQSTTVLLHGTTEEVVQKVLADPAGENT